MQVRFCNCLTSKQWPALRGLLWYYSKPKYSVYKGLSGTEIIKTKLEENGVRHVFGYPGGNALHLIDELHPSRMHGEHLIQYITNACEISTGYTAEGYARASGKTAVIVTTSGPSVTYLIPSLMDAYLDGVAMLAITGQAPTTSPPEAFQECPVVAITQSFTKWNHKVTNISQLPSALDIGFLKANSGRPGPVVIDCPSDVYSHVLDEADGEVDVPKDDQNTIPFTRSVPTDLCSAKKMGARFVHNACKPMTGNMLITTGENCVTSAEYVFHVLNQHIQYRQDECIITTRTDLNHSMQARGSDCLTSDSHALASGVLHSKGAPIGFAVGAKVARPNCTVICIDDTSSFNLTSTELRTVIRHKINIKVVLLDFGWASLMNAEKDMCFKGRRTTNRTRIRDYKLLAESYYIKGLVCNGFDDLEECTEEFMEYEGPILLHVKLN